MRRFRIRKAHSNTGSGALFPSGKRMPLPGKSGVGARQNFYKTTRNGQPIGQRPMSGVGQGVGDFCPGGCPTDASGRVTHRCGPPVPSNVQVFTTIDTETAAGGVATLTYTATTGEFCPEFFMLPDSVAADWKVTDIIDPSGDSLLLGPNDVLGEFFSSKNERGNKIEGCCLSGGLDITVTLENISGTTAAHIQGSFWGSIR